MEKNEKFCLKKYTTIYMADLFSFSEMEQKLANDPVINACILTNGYNNDMKSRYSIPV